MKIKIRKACFRVLDKNGFLLLYAKSRVIVYIENNWTYHIDNVLYYIPECPNHYDRLIVTLELLFFRMMEFMTQCYLPSHLKVLPMPFIITHKKLICVQNHLLSPSRLYLRLLKVNV